MEEGLNEIQKALRERKRVIISATEKSENIPPNKKTRQPKLTMTNAFESLIIISSVEKGWVCQGREQRENEMEGIKEEGEEKTKANVRRGGRGREELVDATNTEVIYWFLLGTTLVSWRSTWRSRGAHPTSLDLDALTKAPKLALNLSYLGYHA